MTQRKSVPLRQAPTLRPATSQDAEAIAHLGAKIFTTFFGHSVTASDLQAYLETSYTPSSIAKDLLSPDVDIIVACANDCIIGFAQLTQGTIEPCIADVERPIELQRLYVDESYHGGGIGRALENEVEKIARERGFRTMWLGVWENNFNAQKAYDRFGFKKVGAHDFVLGTCVQTDWILTKTL